MARARAVSYGAFGRARWRGQGGENIVEVSAPGYLCSGQQLRCGVDELGVSEVGAIRDERASFCVGRREADALEEFVPKSYDDFPKHSDMASYLGAYADAFALRDSIRFRTTVERLEPTADGAWSMTASWPLPAHRLVEGIPIVSSDLLPAMRRGDIVVKPAINRLSGTSVRFVDGSEERVDRIVYATGYRISLPHLTSLVSATGRELPLYRRIAPPELRGLYFAGFVDAPGGLLPVVESQGHWIAAVLAGRLRIPPPERMWQAIEQAERRTRARFPDESPLSVRCDPHAYRRLLHADLRRSRRRVWHDATAAESRTTVAERTAQLGPGSLRR